MRWGISGALLLIFAGTSAGQDEGFRSLFNGKDLTGWDGNPELWRVEDGCIVGQTKNREQLKYNQFLIHEGEFADFEFRCEFQLIGNNNSGVQYRSTRLPDKGDWVVGGYQADMHSNPRYTGMLYDERGRGIVAMRGQKVIIGDDGKLSSSLLGEELPWPTLDLEEWHTLTIIAKGNNAVHKIDGKTVADITDEQESERELSGVLALQVHRGPAMTVRFRNLQIRDTSEQQTPASSESVTVPAKPSVSMKRGAAGKRQEGVVPSWIWLQKEGEPEKNVYFRREFNSSGVGAARLYAACDDRMKIFLDGKQIAEHGSWSDPIFIDLTKHLDLEAAEKRHVLAVEAENGTSAAGLLVRLDLESGWRDAWSIVSDGEWQASVKPEAGWKQIKFKPQAAWQSPEEIAALGQGPWARSVNAETLAAAAPLKTPTATPVESLRIADGFRVELLYSVPKEEQGSWVNMCVDPRGRLIVSDQYGSLYRVTPPPVGSGAEPIVEEIPVDIGEAQGLLWAFDSLYVSVNKGKKYPGGLYRVTDTNNDDVLDTVVTLRALNGSGEHGPHAVLPHPDGKSLVIVCGNRTDLTEIDASRLPTWDEDLLVPRVQGRFMRGTRAPGGCIYKINPEGTHWELLAAGFRNQFDAAFNQQGELFTYDADMEWDINTPWYRPTRICHVVSGGEYGWRSGGGKWPVYYADSIPPVLNIGPGSPTGVCFGYGARFPERYQQALFAADWSYGKLYAVHMEPDGATYRATAEEFISGTPLPLTDVVVNPSDGAMYFAIGGRRVQSGLYRVTAADTPIAAQANAPGAVSVTADPNPQASGKRTSQATALSAAADLRRQLEQLHVSGAEMNSALIRHGLGHEDRFVRYAARIALEHQSQGDIAAMLRELQSPVAVVQALMAYARSFERMDHGEAPDIDTPIPDWATWQPSGERAEALQVSLEALGRIDPASRSDDEKVDILRAMSLLFTRISPPDAATRQMLVGHLMEAWPSGRPEIDAQLARMMVYFRIPEATPLLVEALEGSPTQEEQIDYAGLLRLQDIGWTNELEETYFRWFVRASGYQGGSSFRLFVDNIKAEAVQRLSAERVAELKPILDAQPATDAPAFVSEPRSFVREWRMDEALPLIQSGLTGRDFENGRRMFAAASCFACHRFDNQGGAVGPDLTALSGRFSPKDILESVLDPSRVISDQYEAVQIVTADGKSVVGRIINLAGDSLRIQTDMMKPSALTSVDRKQIEEMFPSKTSLMPKGLLNTLNEDEMLDLMAYLLSQGDRNHAMFR